MANTINDINNLKFYTAKGYEIPMQKSYVLTWEFIPGSFASQYVKSSINGYFIGDIDFDDPTQLKIMPGTLEVSFIKQGEIYIRFATQRTFDKNGMPVFAYDDIDPSTGRLNDIEYFNYLNSILLHNDNKIKISINVKNESFTHTFNILDIFTLLGNNDTYENYTTVKTVYTGENIGANNEFYQTIGVSKIDLVKFDDTETSYIQQVFEDSVPNIGVYFPFVRYAGDFYQDKVSSNFIAADTLLVLEEVRNEDDTYSYVKPYINADSKYSLIFQPSNNSELKIIDKASEYNVLYKDEAAFAMANSQSEENIAEPFSFAIAFQAEEEGAYQNLLGIYLRSQDNPEYVFFMGAISVKSEVEGEDERFRTLLTNFGIPDPKNYSNLFAEQDYQEDGDDYQLINKKSKELMLTYDQIFSYVGTYKALFNAIKFLGYQDIIFKEWYTIKDQNDKLSDIAVQVFDSSTGDFLKQKLADYGVSIEDFNNYNKLNKISMIYHFNEQSDDVEKIKTTLSRYNKRTGKIEIVSSLPRTLISEVPMTQPIAIYRNEEIFAKLFAVKQWLEQHIIGVGAYISDITGEGVYFNWQKTQGYSTQHYLNDFSQEQYYTPDVKAVLPFIESKGKIACTLNELNNAIRFIDYDNTPINAFDKYDISINLQTNDGTIDTSVLTISNSIEAPVLGDEYEFKLINRPNSGSLYEWTSKDSSSQILIQDGEITLLFDKDSEAYIDSSCLPIITLENANIHNAYGNWRSNIKWMIRETINEDTGNTEYVLKNYNEYLISSNKKVVNRYIVIEPSTADAYIKYSEKNKWDIPMFIIHGYKFANIDINESEENIYKLNDSDSDFILEILKGDMLFKDKDNCGCQISFSSDLLKNNQNTYTNEQQIQPTYTYHSERVPFINLNSSLIEYQSNNSINCQNILNDISINTTNSINEIYDNIIETRLDFLTNIDISNNVAYLDAISFTNTSNFINDNLSFINELQHAKKIEILNSSLNEIIENNYTCNKTIDVEITRLGEYELVVKAFDKYNNIFTSKYDNNVNVIAQPFSIDTFVGNNRSNNETNFYKSNLNGILLDSSQLNEILSQCNNKINYPKSYHIFDIDYNLENDYVEFDNISYAIDTPKNNDIVIFDTLTERCVGASQNGEYVRLHMLDENPNKISLYDDVSLNIEDVSIKKQLSIFAFNKLEKEIYTIGENLDIYDSSLINQTNDINFEADSFIDISTSLINANNINEYIENGYALYILNTTQYPLIIGDNSNVKFDYENKKTIISFNGNQLFNVEDVVKIRYCMNGDIYSQNEYSIENSSLDFASNHIINETAYRIINVSSNINDENRENLIYEYTLNGLINTTLLNSSDVHTYIMYAAQHPVRYSTKILSDAYEFNDIIGFENYSILRDHFNFNSKHLFLNDYIDDTYGLEVNDYDYINGEKYWLDATKYIENVSVMNIYCYHQFPISITQGADVIFKLNDSNNVFKNGYKIDWKVSALSVDELDNEDGIINNNRKEILFRSINDILTIKPYMLGSHDIELTCTDIYGNRLINKGEGLLFVNENETGEYKNYSYI